MRVINERRWRRTKGVFTVFVCIAALWSMGGLEGEEPLPYGMFLPTVLLCIFGYMVVNLTDRK